MHMIRTIFQMIMVLAGLILMANAAFMSTVSNFNIGIVLTFAAGIFFLFTGVFLRPFLIATRRRPLSCIRYILFGCMVFEIGLISFLAVYGHMDTTSYDEQAVIVLGGGIRGERVTQPLQYRLDTAVLYAEKNPEALIVVSGGQGFQETITEALAMERYLVQRGISPERIIKEEKSTSTYENFVFSKRLLDEQMEESYQIVLVTNHFHIYRASRLAKIVGFSASHLHADLQSYAVPANYLRETLAVMKLWIFKR